VAVTAHRREIWIGAGLAVLFIAARTIPFLGANIGRGLDTYDYRFSASLPPLSRDFLAGARPFGYPLYLKLVRHNEHAAVVGQLLIDTAAWLALALMAARATRNAGLRVAVAGVVLAIGATFEAIQWDRVVSSEALSTAFGVGVLAAILWLRERWTAPRLALVAVLALVATAVRDSNGTFFGFVALVLVVAYLVRRVPRRVLALALVLFAVAIVGSVSASIGRRWEGPLTDVITLRIMNSPERLAYFEHSGMPLSNAQIKAARGHCVSPTPFPACVTLVNPQFYAWIAHHGRSTYVASLAKFPATTLWEPVAHLRYSIGTRAKVEVTTGTDEHAPLSQALEAVFFARNPLLNACWAVMILALAASAVLRRIRGVFVIAAALVALSYPHLWLIWIGDALEVTRHSLLASVQLRLGLWLGTVWLLDAILESRRRPPAPATGAVTPS
jgi:hypothetical protein